MTISTTGEAPSHVDYRIEEINWSGRNITDETMPDLRLFPNLHTLNLAGNGLTGLPLYLEQLPFLETINLSNNQLIQPPSALRLMGLRHLQQVDLSDNRLTNVNPTLFALSTSCHVYMRRNYLPQKIVAQVLEASSENGPVFHMSGQRNHPLS